VDDEASIIMDNKDMGEVIKAKTANAATWLNDLFKK